MSAFAFKFQGTFKSLKRFLKFKHYPSLQGRVVTLLIQYIRHNVNPFTHTTILQQTNLNVVCQNISIIEWITYDKKWKTLWQKEKLHVLCNFFFCHYVFKKLSAAEASESVYMRERVNPTNFESCGSKIDIFTQYLEFTSMILLSLYIY